MAKQEEFYKGILDNLYDGVYFVDRERRITYWNGGAERITGHRTKDVIGRSCAHNILNHVDDQGRLLCIDHCPLAETMEDGKMREVSVFLHHTDGHRLPVSVRATPLYDDEGKIVGAVEVFSDNSSKIAALEKIKELQKAALLDSLTGVGNRRYAEMELNARLNEIKRHDSTFGVIFVDIDQFKDVNDRFGHQAGDQALRMVAKTLASNLRSYDFIGRWGGEEFLIISDSGDGQGLTVAEKLRILVENSNIHLDDGDIRVTISMGATIARENDTVKSLMERADKLLYESKKKGRNRVSLD